jgi:glycine cleavage system H protein
MDPQKLRYTKSHEWASLDGDVCTVGITTFAAQQLTDVTYIELPHVGDHLFAGKEFGELETVKAVSALYAPCDGEVIEVNEKVVELATEAKNEGRPVYLVTASDGLIAQKREAAKAYAAEGHQLLMAFHRERETVCRDREAGHIDAHIAAQRISALMPES